MDQRVIRNIVAVVVVAVVVFFGLRYAGVLPSTQQSAGYQAVFLTNGQVYFGKLQVGAKTVTLTDIYYLQVEGQIQPEKEGQQPKLSLVKLGNELHGPQDKMTINRDQVLFWEDLKDDGKVVTAIKDHKAGKTSQ